MPPPTPYFADDLTTLYNADCLAVMREMPDESVDIVVTSPPYNMGLVPGGNGRGMYRPGASNKAGRFRDGYGQHDDAMDQAAYDTWQREVLAECWRISRPGETLPPSPVRRAQVPLLDPACFGGN